MVPEIVTDVSFEMFQELINGKKVIILYPRYQHHNLFLAYFLRHNPDSFLYYRIPQTYPSLTAWLLEMVNQLAVMLPGFGQNVLAASPNTTAKAIGEALAGDLAALPMPRSVLYLDELDRIPYNDDFIAFIRALVNSLAPQTQLVVNARSLRYQPWIDMVNNQQVAVLGTAFRRNNLIFHHDGERRPQIEVYAFGHGQAIVDGNLIENWDGALPRNLFFFFIDNPRVTRKEIFQVFWPALSPKEATNVFHVTKRKITERISENVIDPDDYELTMYGGGFYGPNPRIMRHYDVGDFEDALRDASRASDITQQQRLYRCAVEIYRAPFLMTLDSPWVQERREKLRQLYIQALAGLAHTYKEQNRPSDALSYFIRVLKEAPQREDIHREAMLMYGRLGRIEDAKGQYELLVKHLDHTVGVPPSRETRNLYDNIINGNL
jgi:two-component SAPR family response regulator